MEKILQLAIFGIPLSVFHEYNYQIFCNFVAVVK